MWDNVTRQCPQTTTFEEKADSNRGPSAYQPNTSPLSQTGSLWTNNYPMINGLRGEGVGIVGGLGEGGRAGVGGGGCGAINDSQYFIHTMRDILFLPFQFLFQRCSPSPSSSVTSLCINAYPPPYTVKLLLTCVIESPNKIIFGQLSADMLTVGKGHRQYRNRDCATRGMWWGLRVRLSREHILSTFGFDCYVPWFVVPAPFRQIYFWWILW